MNHPDIEDIVAKKRVDHMLSIGPMPVAEASPLKFGSKLENNIKPVWDYDNLRETKVRTDFKEIEKPLLRVKQTSSTHQPSYELNFSRVTRQKAQKRKAEDLPTKRAKKVKVPQKITSSSHQVYDFVVTQVSESEDSPFKIPQPRPVLSSEKQRHKVKTGLLHTLDSILATSPEASTMNVQVLESRVIYGTTVSKILTDRTQGTPAILISRSTNLNNQLQLTNPVSFTFNNTLILTSTSVNNNP